MTAETPAVAGPAAQGTGSRATRILGWLAIVTMGLSLLFGLILSGPEVNMGDSVRVMYVHLPSIAVAYLAFLVTLVGSALYLRSQSVFWDLLAGSVDRRVDLADDTLTMHPDRLEYELPELTDE